MEGRTQTSFLGLPTQDKVRSTDTPQAFVHYGTSSLSFSSKYRHPSSLPDLLTWRGTLIEMSGHFSQCVPPAGVARDADGVFILLNFIFQLLLLPYFFTNGGLQQAVGGDGAVPEEPVEVGIHGKEHRLQNTSKSQTEGCFAYFCTTFSYSSQPCGMPSVGILFERLPRHHVQMPNKRLEGENNRITSPVVLD